MTSSFELDDLEAAQGVPPNQSYSFPAASTQWTAPDKRRWKYRLYDKLIYLFNLSVEPFFPASLVPHLSSDVYSFLTHETLNVCHESSPSQDYSCMGVLVFPRLHHLNLHGFEKELEDELHALDITKTTSKEQVMRVRVLLRDYGSAIRDFENLLQRQFQPPSATKSAKGPRKRLFPFHETLLPTMMSRMDTDPDRARKDNIYYGFKTPYTRWGGNFLGKATGSLFGGLMLVVPMIIMTIHTSVVKSLVTSSISVGLVAFAVSTLSDGTWRDVLGITAAYAAVLVVFVGTSVSGHS